MLDLARGPFVVGVADWVEALAASAKLARAERPFDLVEARVDLFSNQRLDPAGAEACAALEASGTPVLVTIRSATQGGRFAAGEGVRLERFREALAAASWADIEDDAKIIGQVAALVGARANGQLIVSHHDFSETPSLATLRGWVDACHAAAKNAVAKVATAVRSPSDGTTLQALLRERPARAAVIGMSAEDGGLRVALAAAGSLLAYGYLSRPTAPGQMSAEALHHLLLDASTSYADRRARSSLAI